MKITMSALLAHMFGNLQNVVLNRQGGYGNYHTRKTQVNTPKVLTDIERCPCWAFKFCDLAYQGFTDEEKAEWRDALKKRGMSAYDLWMKECLTAVNAGENPPDHPSISGGWSTANVVPGTSRPLPQPNPCQVPPFGSNCVNCNPTDETPAYIQCETVGLVNEAAAYNGTVVVVQAPMVSCDWSVLIPPTDYILERLGPTFWDYTIEGGEPIGNVLFRSLVAPPNCADECVLDWFASPPPWGDQTGATCTLSIAFPP